MPRYGPYGLFRLLAVLCFALAAFLFLAKIAWTEAPALIPLGLMFWASDPYTGLP